MSKNKSQWIYGCVAIAVLCVVGVILRPSNVFSDVFYMLCIYVVVDAFAVILAYSILKKLNEFIFWKFAVYLAAVVGGSLAINFLLFALASKSFVTFALIVFVLLASLNFLLSKTIFALNVREACLVSLLVGLVNTLICLMGTAIPNCV